MLSEICSDNKLLILKIHYFFFSSNTTQPGVEVTWIDPKTDLK